MDKLIFFGAHYAALLAFVLACWGIGQCVLRRLLQQIALAQRWLAHGLSLCIGMGIVICVLQLLGVSGLLTLPWLIALMTAGWTAAALQMFGATGWTTYEPTRPSGRLLRLHWTVWLLLLLGLGVVLFPLRPPYAFDELMYHLPHAQQWADSGRLKINDWLRYPYFPYNYNLLYAAALVLYDDVMPHLLHALAGWTTALLLYQLALRQSTRVTACVAAAAWMALTRAEFGNAYIDMALAMFLLAGWIAFTLWWEAGLPRPVCWLVVAAFLLGVAAGTKYQMLAFLPFFALAVLLRERRPKVLLAVLAAGVLPCAYWYVRNAVLTGDPFDPLGGNVFGFYDWNRADLEFQLKALRDVRDWPHWLLWPAAVALLMPSVWRHRGLRLTLAFGAYGFVVWLMTSRYSRYLMPFYPMLLLLAAHAAVRCISVIAAWLQARSARLASPTQLAQGRMQGFAAAALLLLALQTTSRSLTRDWAHVAATPAQREAFLHAQYWIHKAAVDFLNRLPGARIYQHGMEGALYYAPQPIYGDHFGRWRYTDFIGLPPQKLAARMTASGLDTLALRTDYSQHLLQHKDFSQCFETVYQDPTAAVAILKSDGNCKAAVAEDGQPPMHPGFVFGPSSAAAP